MGNQRAALPRAEPSMYGRNRAPKATCATCDLATYDMQHAAWASGSPVGQLRMTQLTIPPTESLSSRAAVISAAILFAVSWCGHRTRCGAPSTCCVSCDGRALYVLRQACGCVMVWAPHQMRRTIGALSTRDRGHRNRNVSQLGGDEIRVRHSVSACERVRAFASLRRPIPYRMTWLRSDLSSAAVPVDVIAV